ncbi:hypothetical protein DZ860_19320 [Vibrio sinensis]|uniref:OmpR/PhoB-type domain-containing protein n=1 Tax=Vibrio sinensis TaxID=2302434 RepID=A0A3A6Q7P7_9VIBR|nr:winged helix-turn-helix domain-containing protein [Vibrio sinensis]RJX67168.1 hypothetical protein DZ860_19320 [Vibrio sinensis]
MNTTYLKLGDFYWKKESRTLFQQDLSKEDAYNEVGILTNKQYTLLCCLLDAHPMTLNRDEIIEKVWQTKHISAESLPQLIIRTRQVFNDKNKHIIVNEPGIGYKLNFSVTEPILEHVTNELDTSINDSVNNAKDRNDDEIKSRRNKFDSIKKHITKKNALLFLNLSLTLFIVLQIGILLSAVYYKNVYKNIGVSEPYPYTKKINGQTILKIGNYDCIFIKEHQLLNCK